MITAMEALLRLREGNRRFVSGICSTDQLASPARRTEVVRAQDPYAVILGCSDSRVPAEIVFDQGLGDLFVIRVAGNVVAPSQIGSVEFAAEWFGTQLVVVLGHTYCGAVIATLEQLKGNSQHASHNLRSIVDRVRPAVLPLLDADPHQSVDALLSRAVRANVRASVNQLQHGSEVIEQLVRKGSLLIVGAEYSLATGEVAFFEGVPEGAALD